MGWPGRPLGLGPGCDTVVGIWPGLLLSPCFRGAHTGQHWLVQFFQCEMISLDDAQWGTGQDLPDWQVVMWDRTFFMVLQWGMLH